MSTCQKCTLPVNSNQLKIVCSTCDRSFHAKCVNMSTAEITYLNDGKKDTWSCLDCLKSSKKHRSNSSSSYLSNVAAPPPLLTQSTDQFQTLLQEIQLIRLSQDKLASDINTKYDNLSKCLNIFGEKLDSNTELLTNHSKIIKEQEEAIQKCSTDLKHLQANHDILKSRVQEISCHTQTNTRPASTISYHEIRQRLLRENNVIIKGIPENNETSLDLAFVKEITNCFSGISTTPDVIREVTRIGNKSGNKARPIKVSFNNREAAISVLRNKSILRSNLKFSKITISDDKTPAQLAELNHRRDELKQRIEKGETDLTIKYIRGSPIIVNTKENTPKN